jgi:hypothetical protein
MELVICLATEHRRHWGGLLSRVVESLARGTCLELLIKEQGLPSFLRYDISIVIEELKRIDYKHGMKGATPLPLVDAGAPGHKIVAGAISIRIQFILCIITVLVHHANEATFLLFIE